MNQGPLGVRSYCSASQATFSLSYLSECLESEELNQVSRELSYLYLVPSLNKIGAVCIHVIILVRFADVPYCFFLHHSIFFLLVKALI